MAMDIKIDPGPSSLCEACSAVLALLQSLFLGLGVWLVQHGLGHLV